MLLSQKLFPKIRVKFIPICSINQQFLIIITKVKKLLTNEKKKKIYISKINFKRIQTLKLYSLKSKTL